MQGGGLQVWGSPYSCGHSPNDAFQSGGEARLGAIPRGGRVDVLLTHGPLPAAVLRDCAPRLYVSGHIHERHGVAIDPASGTVCVNSSICNARYEPANRPVVVDLRMERGRQPGASAGSRRDA